ncbi:MAG: glycoside hydrolase family 30 protein [Janthinobacterium lividum]
MKLTVMAGTLLLGALHTPLAQAQPGAAPRPAAPYSAAGKQAAVYTTAANTTLRLTPGPALSFHPVGQPLETEHYLLVDPNHSFQTLLGIGGALTDASAETFDKLPKARQQEFMRAYFDPSAGIGYTLARTSIHSCDFSSESYTYVADQDAQLNTFSVRHDEKYRIPFIKQAIRTAGGQLTLFASPWSPPGWMKTSGDMLHGGQLLPQYRQSWANYCARFIKAYEQHGIPVWGMTVQNEPLASQTWESCVYSGQEERDFVKNFLGPTLEQSGLGDKKLVAWDHNRDLLYERAQAVYDDPEAAKYLWGLGYHWYEGWTGTSMLFHNVRRVQAAYPDKHLLFTEGCNGNFQFDRLNDWSLGERYGYSMINDFNAGTAGWTDWNVLLDETGGPNHVGNFCFAPVIADTRSNQLIYTSAYYYIGHFSKFIRPGAQRLSSASNRDWLQTTAFRNPDSSVVVVVLNKTDTAREFQLWIGGQAAPAHSAAHSIMTLLIRP